MVEVKYEDFVALKNLYDNFKYSTVKVPAKSKLYIHKDVVMSRDSIRNSGYTIVRDMSKADYVVADIKKSLNNGYITLRRYRDSEFNSVSKYWSTASTYLSGSIKQLIAPKEGETKFRCDKDPIEYIVLLSQDNLVEPSSLEIQRHTVLDVHTLTTIESYLKSSDPEVIKLGVSLCTQCTSEDKYLLSYMRTLLSSLSSKYLSSVAAKQLIADLYIKVPHHNSTYYIESEDSLEMYKKFVQNKLSELYNVNATEAGIKIHVNYNVDLEVK